MANNSGSSGGIGLCGAVFCIFLVMKLVGVEPVAGWSWWWVTAPLWGPVALVLALVGVVALVTLVPWRAWKGK